MIADPTDSRPLLQVKQLGVRFLVKGGFLRPKKQLKALTAIDFDVAPGESLGIVGETGSGKSTLARSLLGLVDPSEGSILWAGKPLERKSRAAVRKDLQVVFQDSLGSLDPRWTVGQSIAEALTTHSSRSASEIDQAVQKVMTDVGLRLELAGRFPHELSGGQAQRVAIARGLILRPRMIVFDEPVSALDVSTQAQILNLIDRIRKSEGLSYLFISHDLAVVRRIVDRVLVLYLGRIMEIAGRDEFFARPRHPYSQALIAAVPSTRGHKHQHAVLSQDIPSPLAPPSGCVFRTRCPKAADLCAATVPPLVENQRRHLVACHFPG
ncbi:MAG TPA: oligopeptide/dipeptide ABC transporter ATP-binding protein [Rhizobiaceae bacterium]|nr:oligopeptide/dipeptide ABC transporter ATP-binding protein [Rhizobiaceae bacterium]